MFCLDKYSNFWSSIFWGILMISLFNLQDVISPCCVCFFFHIDVLPLFHFCLFSLYYCCSLNQSIFQPFRQKCKCIIRKYMSKSIVHMVKLLLVRLSISFFVCPNYTWSSLCHSILQYGVVICGDALRKHAYSNILKILPPEKWKFEIKKKSDIFHISAQNIDCGYSLEPPQRGGSNEYPQSMFWAEMIKIMYTPVNPSFTI